MIFIKEKGYKMTNHEDFLNLVSELNDVIYDEKDINVFYSGFSITTDGCSQKIELNIEGSELECLTDDSDRGWNDEKDDYERTDVQQIIYELELFKSRFEKILDKVKKHLDK